MICKPLSESVSGKASCHGYVNAEVEQLDHLSNWFAGSASWRTAFLLELVLKREIALKTLRKAAIPEVFGLALEKCVLHGHTVEQVAIVPNTVHYAKSPAAYDLKSRQ
ncbi:hypothetical protein Mal48_10560 [Thalassoglobus polymorphus]|uniref:Uncharacterized protein n=1 Tax=Thalassoglobus polymorphus TaxID=2527994 RepID=A0A517QJK0_9PLAN|nr:hypothetical protein Mal48_10560 [Thalassoglobus polymorphus]